MRRTTTDLSPPLDVDNIIEKYKRCVAEQTTKMSELKRVMADYDRSLSHTRTAKVTRLSQPDAKDALIQSLREEIENLKAKRTESDLREDLRIAHEKVKTLTQENNRLQEQLKGVRHEVRTLRKPGKDPLPAPPEPRNLTRDLQGMSRELTQLVHLVRSLKSGDELDMKYLLGGDQYHSYPETVESLLQIMRKDLNEVRTEVSNLYADHCGSKCAPQ